MSVLNISKIYSFITSTKFIDFVASNFNKIETCATSIKDVDLINENETKNEIHIEVAKRNLFTIYENEVNKNEIEVNENEIEVNEIEVNENEVNKNEIEVNENEIEVNENEIEVNENEIEIEVNENEVNKNEIEIEVNEIKINEKDLKLVEFENEDYNVIYKSNEDLYLISSEAYNNENILSEFEMQCNGLIFEKSTNKLVCANNNIMFNLKNVDELHTLLNKCTTENKKTRIEYCEDGTIIRLYNYKDEWYTATNKCINANESFWCSNKSFDSMFWDIFDKSMLNNLDKNYTYMFILLHRENRIVVKHTKNMLVYLNRINNETLKEDYTNIFYNVYGIKRSQLLKNPDQLLTCHPYKRGLVVKIFNEQNDSWYAYKYDFPEYTFVKSIRGNVPQLRYRYLELLKDTEMLQNLQKYYNEHMFMFEMIKNSLLKLAKTIHKLYINSHVKHIVKVDETNIYYQTLRQLHAYYKTKNQTITFDVVKQKINNMEKHILRKLLGWI